VIFLKVFIAAIFVVSSLSGCLTVGGNSFKFDYDTGLAEVTYHDFRSQKGYDEDDYSIEKDWEELKESVEEPAEVEDEGVLDLLTQELFQEDDALSGKMKVKVNCPKCFPSKQAALEYLHKGTVGLTSLKEKESDFRTINNEIFFFVPSGTEIVATNGKVLKTSYNNIIVWQEEQKVFEYQAREAKESGGKSLLPFYLKEQETQKK